MAHPYHHSLSSSRKFGGTPSDYQPIHDWFDHTKAIYGNFRHRALRHHTEGVAMAASVFGSQITNSDGTQVAVVEIGRQHIIEDCGTVVRAFDWLGGLTDLGRLTPKPVSVEEQSALSVRKLGGVLTDYLPLHSFLDEFEGCGVGFLALRHHSWGLFDAEQVFGSVLKLSTGVKVPVRYVGELHLMAQFGRIPSALDFLEKIPAEKWMLHAAGPAARELKTLSQTIGESSR